MSSWTRVTTQSPCAVCGKSDWCSYSVDRTFAICRRRDDGTGRPKVDRGGAEYWVYRVGEPIASATTWTPAPKPPASRLEPFRLHQIYASVLESLPLVAADRRALRQRGLDDHEIGVRQYRTFTRAQSRDVLARALATFGRAICLEVPGIVAEANGDLILAGASGLLVPVRNPRGEIIALKIRRAQAQAPRYVYLSSTHAGGPGPGSPVHVPLHGERVGHTVRLTEGEIKADVATALDGLLTIAIAGVGTWRRALPVLRALGATTCRLALDSDVRTNPHVARALKNMAQHLTDEGFAIELERWDPNVKGIDDCLAAGIKPEVITGDRALAECLRLGAGPTSAAPSLAG